MKNRAHRLHCRSCLPRVATPQSSALQRIQGPDPLGQFPEGLARLADAIRREVVLAGDAHAEHAPAVDEGEKALGVGRGRSLRVEENGTRHRDGLVARVWCALGHEDPARWPAEPEHIDRLAGGGPANPWHLTEEG